jgi:hypothetical protein
MVMSVKNGLWHILKILLLDPLRKKYQIYLHHWSSWKTLNSRCVQSVAKEHPLARTFSPFDSAPTHHDGVTVLARGVNERINDITFCSCVVLRFMFWRSVDAEHRNTAETLIRSPLSMSRSLADDEEW